MKPTLTLLIASSALCLAQANRPALRAEGPRRPEEKVADQNPFTSRADAELGQKLFMRRCALCHGAHGEGGRGVNLTTGKYRMGGSDRQLFATLRNGIPDSEMPGTNAPANDVWRLAAFVRRLGTAGTSEKAAGDPEAGRAVYNNNGCAQCHSIGDSGGDLGPSLKAIGRRRSLKYLRDSIVDPAADAPLEYRAVTVVTLDGKKIRGAQSNEDDYSIQLRDMTGNPRSFLKSELREFAHGKDSLMPAYGSLSARDLDNLIAYLSSLR